MELVINNLSKRYSNGIQALDGVSLSLSSGVFGLLGPNGAGKSTLMRIVATLLKADQGSVHLDGLDVLSQRMEVRKRLGYLPQSFGFYPRSTAQSFLSHFARLRGITAKKDRQVRVEELLRRVNLWEARKQKLGTFSGGMKQRFGIALVLLSNPSLVIVDEPTAGLDPLERTRFLNLLSEVGEEVIVILSTHIVEDVSGLCTSMAIINNGTIQATGAPNTFIQQLQGAIWKTSIDKKDYPEFVSRYRVISSYLLAGKLVLHVHSNEHPGGDFSPTVPSLQDVYFYTLPS